MMMMMILPAYHQHYLMESVVFRPIALWEGLSYLFAFEKEKGNSHVDGVANDPVVHTKLAQASSSLPFTTTSSPSMALSSDVPSMASTYCGCIECTPDIWNHDAYGITCGERIEYLQTSEGGNLNEADACQIVSNQYPTLCDFYECNPLMCDV